MGGVFKGGSGGCTACPGRVRKGGASGWLVDWAALGTAEDAGGGSLSAL